MTPFESWIDRQVREAQERGEFDNLPGAGKPLPWLNGREDENWWVKALIEREKLSAPLPVSLALRKEVEDLPRTLADVGDERTARDIVEDVNARIRDALRRPLERPVAVLTIVDVDAAVEDWRRGRHS
ncbi:MAG TPA: DUF1992 domain-containing protein [Propionibacteriaceae bacterium]|nr:DUF1992 domain-containing protein [Propionibacteriaceae bacterium]